LPLFLDTSDTTAQRETQNAKRKTRN